MNREPMMERRESPQDAAARQNQLKERDIIMNNEGPHCGAGHLRRADGTKGAVLRDGQPPDDVKKNFLDFL